MSSVPPGGLILITGADGYIASVAVQVFLQRGYHVRGTVRSITANAWMKAFFGSNFELVEVPDISTPGAFDEALQGNQGVIDVTINSNLYLLESAAKVLSVKSVVITSSLAACALPTAGEPYKIDATTWNTDAIDKTSEPWGGQGNPRWHGIALYGAAKARSEQAAFSWVREHKPSLSFNTVVPNVNFGIAISPENMSYRSSAAVIDGIVKGYPDSPSILPSQWYVDVEDTALLHLAALTLGDVNNERLLAFGGRYCWTVILEILHRRFPGKVLLKDVKESAVDAGEVDNKRSADVLRKMGNHSKGRTQSGAATSALMKRITNYREGRTSYNLELFGGQLIQPRLTSEEGNLITARRKNHNEKIPIARDATVLKTGSIREVSCSLDHPRSRHNTSTDSPNADASDLIFPVIHCGSAMHNAIRSID
ncbi:aldehyde reductase II [Fusarium napiforme]|uniref:Aldehyde reductase II n=1 Tax=Fusarium napiforme TaxID=42672 RepID=A0A8H5NGD7_9HYPO|nr:aldehyde reductase II [Fusarium napiforme]